MTNKKPYLMIDTAGQLTPVFTQPVPRNQQAAVGAELLKKYPNAGQVAFLEKRRKRATGYRARMMGGELSINGSLASAYVLAKKENKSSVRLYVSGLNRQVEASLGKSVISISLPLSVIKSVNGSIVFFTGIKFLVQRGFPKQKKLTQKQKTSLDKMASSSPAAGIVFYKRSTIVPVVRVKATQTTVWETACGSGSLAYYLVTGQGKVKQPSGSTITINKNNDKLTITVPVKELNV